MPLLYYWKRKIYYNDLDNGVGYHLNQHSPVLHDIEPGDSLWAFTRNKAGRYVLAAELVVRARTFNPPSYRYGLHRVWGDLRSSRYFRVEDQPSFEQIIRALSVRVAAPYLGQSFQGRAAVRRLTEADQRILAAASSDLELEPRARLLPEERLEAALLLGDAERVEELIKTEKPGIAEARQAYLYGTAPTRNRQLADELHRMYEGRCQLCLWAPVDEYGHRLCHAHHIHWLSRGGRDEIANLMLVCPNHHAAIHRCDAPLDFRTGTFLFPYEPEHVQLNSHLPLWN